MNEITNLEFDLENEINVTMKSSVNEDSGSSKYLAIDESVNEQETVDEVTYRIFDTVAVTVSNTFYVEGKVVATEPLMLNIEQNDFLTQLLESFPSDKLSLFLGLSGDDYILTVNEYSNIVAHVPYRSDNEGEIQSVSLLYDKENSSFVYYDETEKGFVGFNMINHMNNSGRYVTKQSPRNEKVILLDTYSISYSDSVVYDGLLYVVKNIDVKRNEVVLVNIMDGLIKEVTVCYEGNNFLKVIRIPSQLKIDNPRPINYNRFIDTKFLVGMVDSEVDLFYLYNLIELSISGNLTEERFIAYSQKILG